MAPNMVETPTGASSAEVETPPPAESSNGNSTSTHYPSSNGNHQPHPQPPSIILIPDSTAATAATPIGTLANTMGVAGGTSMASISAQHQVFWSPTQYLSSGNRINFYCFLGPLTQI